MVVQDFDEKLEIDGIAMQWMEEVTPEMNDSDEEVDGGELLLSRLVWLDWMCLRPGKVWEKLVC